MARKIFDVSILRMTFVTGQDEFGKAKTATKKFVGVKEDVEAAQLQQFAEAYASLSTHALAATTVTAQHTIAQ